ncbi:DUF6153 family protein [Sinomonas humi]|uniref:Uncharacterized protein n=1 Tax=Sinomonas humi TaxID=1338436 RepID=A0A0B2APY6_9MICC|nr:DUF6153 family protein [Sinomonas humi]KHL03923.1 hypothetical protein LK10_07650 [Sinomonas humi]
MRRLLALLVLPLVLGLLGMHAVAAHAIEPVEAAGQTAAGQTAAGQTAAGHTAAGQIASTGTDDDACHPGCPPSGAEHPSDCIPAPGAQAPSVPAVVVLLRSDAVQPGPVGTAPVHPGALRASGAPELHDLSISRT